MFEMVRVAASKRGKKAFNERHRFRYYWSSIRGCIVRQVWCGDECLGETAIPYVKQGVRLG